MSRTKRFVAGVGVGYAHQIVVTVVGLFLTPFLLWRLGAHQYGLWLTGTQVIAYLTLLDLGVLAILPRETAYATGRAGGTPTGDELPEVFGRTVRILLWQMPLIMSATVVAWWFLPAAWTDLRLPLALMLAAFVLTYPLRIFHATLQGFQDLAFIGGLQLAAWAGGTTLMVVLVTRGWGLEALALGAVATQLVSLGGCTYRVFSRFPIVFPPHLPRLGWRQAQPHLTRAFWVSVSQVSHVLLYATDLLIVAWIFGPVTVVPYACTQKLIAVLSNQPQMLTQAAAPALSELRMAAARPKLLAVTSSLSLALMLASGAVLVLVLAVNGAFVSWWVGADQYGGAVLTGLFAAAMLVRHWNTALVYSLFSFGYERRLSLTAVADGVVTLALSSGLAHVFGVTGVPLGFLAGALLVSIPANLTALARETGVSPLGFAATLKPWALRLAILLPFAAGANLFVRAPSLLFVAGTAAAAALAYAAIMWPVALRPPLGDYVRGALGPVFARFGRPAPAAAAPDMTLHT